MTLNKQYVTLLAMFLITGTADLRAQQKQTDIYITLNQSLALAKEHNISLKVSEEEVNVAAYNEKISFQEKLPDLEFSAGYNRLANIKQFENNGLLHQATTYDVPNQQYHFTLGLSVPIYAGGRIKAEEKIATLKTEVAHLGHKKEERAIKLSVVTAFLQIQLLMDQRTLIASKIKEDSIMIKQVEALKNNGKVTKNELLRTKLQSANHHMILSEVTNNILIAEHQLATLLNLPSDKKLHIVEEDLVAQEPQTILPLESYLTGAFEDHEEIKSAEQQILIMQQEKKLVKANYLPQVNLKGDYGLSYPNFMFFPPEPYLYGFGLVGLDLKYSISNLYKNKAKMQRVKSEISKQQYEAIDVREKINHLVFAAYRKVLEADERILIAQEAIAQATENYRLVKMRYINKLSLISELIDADNTFLEAQSAFITAHINRRLNYYQLQFAVGKM
ncbi:TolC family protein [Sphingobacteriaceae bacterium WQ 2009]|uniref:TolC family protein n=1 Tax=Rhinopithecimicrobium faecis TaxID=2820698 RepID=A0A8T4HCM0_9SPHI|nr:TolC family protein [Sphingobacteriaceae bacterium WQ 2009]